MPDFSSGSLRKFTDAEAQELLLEELAIQLLHPNLTL